MTRRIAVFLLGVLCGVVLCLILWEMTKPRCPDWLVQEWGCCPQ